MKKKKFQGLVGLALIASLVNPAPWLGQSGLLESAKVLAAEEETPPEDEILPDANQLKAIIDFTKLNDELESLIDSNPEEAGYLVEDEQAKVDRWKAYLAQTADGKAQAARWDALVARLNGGGSTPTPTPNPDPVVTTRTETIAITTVYTADANLEANKQVETFAGVAGVKTYTTTDGVEDAGVVTVAMQPRQVTVGTKSTVVTESIPAPKDIEELDANLEVGARVLKKAAVPGAKTTTTSYTLNTETGIAVANAPVETIVEGTAAVYLVGTKTTNLPVVTTEEVVETQVVAFETIREDDPNLEVGKEVVETEGVNGERTIVYTVTKTDGVETARTVKSDSITTPATAKVIKVGTKPVHVPVVTTEEVVETQVVAFETIREDDPNLEVGKEVVETEGVNGERTIVYAVTKTDGVETARTVKSDSITTPATAKVIKVGTKPVHVPVVTTEEVVETQVVAFETIREDDPNLEVGKEVVETEGVNGERTIVYTVTKTDGVETARTVKSDSITTPATAKVIKVGTKPVHVPVVTTEEVVETQVVAFETIREDDPNLEVGKEVVETEGVNGERTIVYAVTKTDGVETARTVKSDSITTPATAKVIKVGTKPVHVPVVTTEEVVETQVVAFETIREDDPNLEVGKEVVETEGVNGERTIVYTVTKTDGVETARTVKSDSITTPATAKVIKVGTKPVHVPVVTTEEVVETQVVAFETIREDDPNLEVGKEVVEIEGVNGERTIVYTVTKTDGVETARTVKSDSITTPATAKVIKVGTKPASVTDSKEELKASNEKNTQATNETVGDTAPQKEVTGKKILPKTGDVVATTFWTSLIGWVTLGLATILRRNKKS
ncbi:G5 domain-containing protein [Streptococcus sp. 29896]|uniref:G5 domain-containing protein n=2 Tax=Streptococcus TaxID=1301 RepID=A0AA96VS78_9STRE|nr:G5 domain-containing protein [Streptococcus sp. 29896]WNY47265.1 G5 domain-containing protein [Streptococcus sp. 29896]